MPKKEEKSISKKADGKNPPANYTITILFVFIAVAVFIMLLIFFFFEPPERISTCGDLTEYGSCSEEEPFYCNSETGKIIEEASLCGCPSIFLLEGDSCVSDFQIDSQDLSLNYILEGKSYSFEFVTYGGVADYLSNNVSKIISYAVNETPSRRDFKLQVIDQEIQREFLIPLVKKIQNFTSNKEYQVRIAVSLVQNIPYGFSNKTEKFFGQQVNYSRYPYEVLYDYEGICEEKSQLLVFLLRELGYRTAFFYFQQENHEAVGIGCPIRESYKNTGYCFIETTGPAIITDGSIEYSGGITLNSEPEIIEISEGENLGKNLEEYGDAETLKKIREGKFVLFRNSKLESLREKYGLIEEYNLG